jgi:hypothetical protein
MVRYHFAVGSSHHRGYSTERTILQLPEAPTFEPEEEHTTSGDNRSTADVGPASRDDEKMIGDDNVEQEDEDRCHEVEVQHSVSNLSENEEVAVSSLVDPCGDCHQHSPLGARPSLPAARITAKATITPMVTPPPPQLPLPEPPQPPPPQPPPPQSAAPFCRGNLELWLSNDNQFLTPFHCFIRKECVEAFTVAETTVPSNSVVPGRNIDPLRVGIQCKFCKHQPIVRRSEWAVCFPSCVRNIYYSIDTWHRRHCSTCFEIPPLIRARISELQRQSRAGIGGNRRYWESSANLLGIVNHAGGGIRFCLDLDFAEHIRANAGSQVTVSLSTSSMPASQPIVHSDDAVTTNPFLYLLFSQMETCLYSEDDIAHTKGSKRDVELGRPGFQCKHCNGQRGYGRYFPSSVDSLALANSDRNLYKHIAKCHSSPPSVKASLEVLFSEQKSRSRCREPRGNRRRFFQRVWDRMHAVDGASVQVGGAASCFIA